MTYTLYLGDPAYSSWSLRAWLLFEKSGLPREDRIVDFNTAPVAEQMAGLFPARTVPTLILPDGTVLSESLAIAEELACRHPEAGLWPEDPAARAIARNLAAEMHAGFEALRSYCPMNLRTAYRDVQVPEAVQADLDRIARLWDHARTATRSTTPWLCGPYSIADAFYAPVAARIAGYGLSVPESAAAYVAAHMTDPAFRSWRALGMSTGAPLARYARSYPTVDWPYEAATPGVN